MGTIDQRRHFVKYDLNLSISTYSPDPDPSVEGSMHDELPLLKDPVIAVDQKGRADEVGVDRGDFLKEQ